MARANVTGVREVIANAQRADVTYRDSLAQAIYEEGLNLLVKSKMEVPVQYGDLRRSGYVNPPQDTPRGPLVEMGYGTNYAVYVHERTELRHAIGKAKFLIDPFNRMINGYKERIASRAQQLFQQHRGVR